MKINEILAQVSSYVKPKVLATANSKYSGQLRVVNSFGDVYIATGALTQTGGIVKDLWLPTIQKLKNKKLKKILILGLAGGTLAKIINRLIPIAEITGVEIDPVMIDLSKKHLGLANIKNLKIINKDANNYILETNDHFDVIFVDLYLGDKVPEFVYSTKFLEKLTKSATLLIINHLFYDESKRANAQKLIEKCQMLNCKISLSRILTNILINITPASG